MGRELEEEEAAWLGKGDFNARDLSRRRQTCGLQDAQNLSLGPPTPAQQEGKSSLCGG